MTTDEKIIAGIASRFLDIPTLEIRNLDSLDFHEVCVANLKSALEAAFMAGRVIEARMLFTPLNPDSMLRGILRETGTW